MAIRDWPLGSIKRRVRLVWPRWLDLFGNGFQADFPNLRGWSVTGGNGQRNEDHPSFIIHQAAGFLRVLRGGSPNLVLARERYETKVRNPSHAQSHHTSSCPSFLYNLSHALAWKPVGQLFCSSCLPSPEIPSVCVVVSLSFPRSLDHDP